MAGGAPKGNKNHLKHGMRQSRIYTIWLSMRQRCQNPSSGNYRRYGLRGISVCQEWEDFEAFCSWAFKNGYNDGLTIERKNVNGNYEPNNCTWITKREQCFNKRNTVYITVNGEQISMAKYCMNNKLRYKSFWQFIKKGYSIEEATVKAS
mgnify:CR=1 FL=1